MPAVWLSSLHSGSSSGRQRLASVAVKGFVIEAIRKTVSGAHPAAVTSRRPSTDTPTTAAGTFQRSAAASSAPENVESSTNSLPYCPASPRLRAFFLRAAGLEATSFGEPSLAGTGRDAVDAPYARARRPSGGLVSTVDDLLRFGEWQLAERRTEALRVVAGKPVGGVYGLGFFGERVGGMDVWGHGGSYGGFQSSLLLVPEEAAALAVLTNSWRGSGLIRRVVESLGITSRALALASVPERIDGTYALDELAATVEMSGDGLIVSARERDPVTGSSTSTSFPARALGGGVFGFARGVLLSHRLDFPRAGVARIGWVALTRTES